MLIAPQNLKFNRSGLFMGQGSKDSVSKIMNHKLINENYGKKLYSLSVKHVFVYGFNFMFSSLLKEPRVIHG